MDKISFLTLALVKSGLNELIEKFGDYLSWLGVTETEITEGSTTQVIEIDGEEITVQRGDVVQYGNKFFAFGDEWQEINAKITVENGCMIFK